VYGVKEHGMSAICIKCIEVLHISVEVWYMGDEYEESYECLLVSTERNCMFLYCIWIILFMHTFILYI